MKKFLKIEFGSRGEVIVNGLVDGSFELFEEELEKFKESFDEEDLEEMEEFISIEDNYKGLEGVIIEGRGEEETYNYIEYERYKEDCDKILEVEKRMEEFGESDEDVDLLEKLMMKFF